MSASVKESKVYLSERWTKVAAVLPDYFGSGSQHPNLVVDPSGFRRVVQDSLRTCDEFLGNLTRVEESIEQRIPGITSYHDLSGLTTRSAGGYNFAMSGNIVTLSGVGIQMSRDGQASAEQPAAQNNNKSHIIKHIGDTWLYGGRELETDEVISMQKGLSILHKCYSLRTTTLDCIATFGALDVVLEVGKVYGLKRKIVYFEHGERDLSEESETTELISLGTYWSVLSQVNRMKSTMSKLRGLIYKPEDMLPVNASGTDIKWTAVKSTSIPNSLPGL